MQTASTTRPIRHRPRPAAGRKGNPAKSAEVGTAVPAADGFLTHSFLPLYAAGKEVPEQAAAEQGLLRSLGNLKQHYGVVSTDYTTMPYPYNILLTCWETAKQIKVKQRYRELLIAEVENTITFVVKESFRREFVLHYLPVMPLYALWQKPEHRASAKLLTAVCAYLYINARVSYYRDEDEYMYDNYFILREWINEEPEADSLEDYQRQLAAIDDAEVQGDFVQAKMRETYSEANIYRYANHCADEQKDDDYYERSYVAMHEYVGFIGSADDINSDSLLGMVNNDFNERSDFQEPELTTLFNEPQPAYSDKLDFEYRLFALMDKIATLLYQTP
jgi:hypothetical protein